MHHKRVSTLITFLLLMLCVNYLSAQESRSFKEQTKLIRIKKIATEWQGSKLTLHSRDGQEFRGRLIEVSGGNYHMKLATEELEIPLEDIVKVSFKPGVPELLLSIASAAMGGAFLSGAILIANEDASSQDVGLATLLGLFGGGLWGYSTFYETEVIELE